MVARFLVFSLLAVLVSAADGPKSRSVSGSRVLTPFKLLRQADMESRDFPVEERAGVLQSIAHASLSIDKTRALLWSKELFRTAHQLPLGQDRAAYQKNALITMARVNPLAAAALYKQQDNLRDWATDEIPSEDIRSDRTRTLFPALWSARGKKSLPQIRDIALWLGDTGGYPYSGLTPIFSDIAKEDRNAATDLFLDAITYLPRGQDIRSTNRIFTDFLLLLLCYKCGAPQKGQLESCRRSARARVCRSVAIEQGLCRSRRTGRSPRAELGRYLGDG